MRIPVAQSKLLKKQYTSGAQSFVWFDNNTLFIKIQCKASFSICQVYKFPIYSRSNKNNQGNIELFQPVTITFTSKNNTTEHGFRAWLVKGKRNEYFYLQL